MKTLVLVILVQLSLVIVFLGCKPDRMPNPGEENAPIISSLETTYDTVGATLVINGQNFSHDPAKNEVKFKGVQTVALAVDTTDYLNRLTVKIPSGAQSGKITVRVGDQTDISTQVFNITQGRFIKKTDLSLNIKLANTFVIGDAVYIHYADTIYGLSPLGGGVPGPLKWVKLNPANGQIDSVQIFPAEIEPMGVFHFGNKTWVIPSTDSPSDDIWVYDSQSQTWQNSGYQSIFTCEPCQLKLGLFDFWSLNEKGYVLLPEFDLSKDTHKMYRFEPSDGIWTQIADAPIKPSGYGTPGFTIDGIGYKSYGYPFGLDGLSLIAFDPDLESWTSLNPIPNHGNHAIELNGLAYLFASNDLIRDSLESNINYTISYDPETNTNGFATPFRTPPPIRSAFSLNGKAYILVQNGLWEFIP